MGFVNITNPNVGNITSIGPGESFGELQFVVGGVSESNLVAGTGGAVLKCWSYEALRGIFKENPTLNSNFVSHICAIVRKRLVTITAV
jgi:CRP-like cAMP-binding protein